MWSFWFFIWIAALMVWFRCLFDMFSDSTLSGWAKAAGRSCSSRAVAGRADLPHCAGPEHDRAPKGGGCAAAGRAGPVHPTGCEHFPGPGRTDRKRQGAARFRSHHAGGVRVPQGQGARLTSPYSPTQKPCNSIRWRRRPGGPLGLPDASTGEPRTPRQHLRPGSLRHPLHQAHLAVTGPTWCSALRTARSGQSTWGGAHDRRLWSFDSPICCSPVCRAGRRSSPAPTQPSDIEILVLRHEVSRG